MKIEFIKETKANGNVIYYTKVNNSFVDGSLELTMVKAKVIYDNIVKNNGMYRSEEVLESVNI
jgi:hypothetical protein